MIVSGAGRLAATPSAQVEAAATALDRADGVDPAASYPADAGLTLVLLLVMVGLPALVVMAVVATILVRR